MMGQYLSLFGPHTVEDDLYLVELARIELRRIINTPDFMDVELLGYPFQMRIDPALEYGVLKMEFKK